MESAIQFLFWSAMLACGKRKWWIVIILTNSRGIYTIFAFRLRLHVFLLHEKLCCFFVRIFICSYPHFLYVHMNGWSSIFSTENELSSVQSMESAIQFLVWSAMLACGKRKWWIVIILTNSRWIYTVFAFRLRLHVFFSMKNYVVFSSAFLYVHIALTKLSHTGQKFSQSIFGKGVQLCFEISFFEQNFYLYSYVTIYLVRIWTYKNAEEKARTFSRSTNLKKKADVNRILCKLALSSQDSLFQLNQYRLSLEFGQKSYRPARKPRWTETTKKNVCTLPKDMLAGTQRCERGYFFLLSLQ